MQRFQMIRSCPGRPSKSCFNGRRLTIRKIISASARCYCWMPPVSMKRSCAGSASARRVAKPTRNELRIPVRGRQRFRFDCTTCNSGGCLNPRSDAPVGRAALTSACPAETSTPSSRANARCERSALLKTSNSEQVMLRACATLLPVRCQGTAGSFKFRTVIKIGNAIVIPGHRPVSSWL